MIKSVLIIFLERKSVVIIRSIKIITCIYYGMTLTPLIKIYGSVSNRESVLHVEYPLAYIVTGRLRSLGQFNT